MKANEGSEGKGNLIHHLHHPLFRRPLKTIHAPLLSIGMLCWTLKSRLSRQRKVEHSKRSTLSLWERLLPIIAILVPTSCAMAIWSLHLANWQDSRLLHRLVLHQRVAVQVLVNVLATSLAALWSYSICTVVNWMLRRWALYHQISLSTLRISTLLSQARLETKLSKRGYILCACFWALCPLSQYFWTGALTPTITSYTLPGLLMRPRTGTGSYSFLNRRGPESYFDFDCEIHNQVNESFTNCPGLHQSGALLQSAGSATTIDGASRNHSKYDNSGFRYTGRSYGVGSSVGLTDREPATIPALTYNYTEDGCLTDASCKYNASSLWVIKLVSCPNNTGYPCTFEAQGCFPNSDFSNKIGYVGKYGFPCVSDYYTQAQLRHPSTANGSVIAVGAPNSDNVSDYYMAIAAETNYRRFDQVQCQFWFHPKTFSVKVSAIDKTISVEALGPTTDPEPRGMLKSKVMDALNVVSMVQTTLYVSSVGEALQNNMRNLLSSENQSTADLDNATDDQLLLAIASSMVAMADDTLASMGAFSLLWPGANEAANVSMTIVGVRIGENPYITVVVVWNLMALLIVVILVMVSCVGTIPAFDFTEIASLVTAANIGGREQRNAADLTSALRGWQGNGDFVEDARLAMHYWPPDSGQPPSLQIISTATESKV